jgi:hypothetical protein
VSVIRLSYSLPSKVRKSKIKKRKMTRHNGFNRIILASDCLSMIKKINSSSKDRSSIGSVVGDIRRLASGFSSCVFMHVRRKLNGAAHLLTRRSECDICNISFDVVPDYILGVLCNDVF